jgi:hypothetical protein
MSPIAVVVIFFQQLKALPVAPRALDDCLPNPHMYDTSLSWPPPTRAEPREFCTSSTTSPQLFLTDRLGDWRSKFAMITTFG